jgi:hypothetical protein
MKLLLFYFRCSFRAGMPFALLALVLLFACPSTAQDAPESEPDAEAGVEDTEDGAAPIMLEGDVIYLKSGSTMQGVQVLRGTPEYYEVQLVEGVDPLIVPRRQVERIEYDDVDPIRDQRIKEMFPEPVVIETASGEEVSPELMNQLTAPLPGEPLDLEEQDLVVVLEHIRELTGETVVVDPSIRELPPDARLWTIRTEPDTTLLTLLRERLLEAFPGLALEYMPDKVVVLTKQAQKARREKPDKKDNKAALDALLN